MRGKPTETLEAKLILKQIVLSIAVLASIAVVDLIVGAHDRGCSSPYGISERPQVELMHGDVV
jgi:hypothetical protein